MPCRWHCRRARIADGPDPGGSTPARPEPHSLTTWIERHAVRPDGNPVELLPAAKIPEPGRPIVRGTDRDATVRTDRDGQNGRGMADQRVQRPAGLHVPDAQRAVHRAAD